MVPNLHNKAIATVKAIAAGRLTREWPAHLWESWPDPVKTAYVPPPQQTSRPARRTLHTNDEALVDNKAVASLAEQSNMTPEL